MTTKNKALNYEEHTELGSQIQKAQVDAIHWYMQLCAKYGKSSRAAMLSRKVVKAIDALRNELDNQVCSENPSHLYPDRQPQKAYYGKGVAVTHR